MPLSLSQLRTPATADQETARILDILNSLGFSTTSWQSGSVQRTIVEMMGNVSAQFTVVVDTISRMGFNDSAEGDALTEFSNSNYDNQRVGALATEGDYTLTGALIGPPHAIVAGDLIVSDADGRQYQNSTGGVVPAGGTLVVTIKALVTGTDGNVPPNGTITTLNTPLAGVTGSNDAVAPATTWITTQGQDQESDSVLRLRNTTKWATQNQIGSPAELYTNVALNADADIQRVGIDDTNPRGSGTLDVYLARATATAQPSDIVTVQAAFDAQVCETSDAKAIAATEVAQAFTFTAYIEAAKNTPDTQAAIEEAIADFVNSLAIGGTLIGGSGFMLFSELVTAVSSIDGVVNVVFAAPVADVALASNEIMIVGVVTPTYLNWP